MSRPKISDTAYDQLAEWKARRPVATLMGEFSAGKSTLLNFILGQNAAPTKVTATHMPPTWFTYTETPFVIGVMRDGVLEAVDLESDLSDLRERYLLIRCGLESDALKNCDVIDAPGISDPGLQKDALRFLTRYTDFVVWCTAANQAWRQTENASFNKLSKAVKSQSLLVITRMDKLRTETDRAKVLKRVSKEAGPLFYDVIPLQTPKAAAVADEDRTTDEDGVWVKTGGHAFMKAFTETCAEIVPKTAKGASSTKPQNDTIKAVAPTKTPTPAAPKMTKASAQDLPSAFAEVFDEIKTIPENSQHCQQIEHFVASIKCDLERARPDNATLLECLQIERHDLEIPRLLSQIEREIGAFCERDRVALDAWPVASNPNQ